MQLSTYVLIVALSLGMLWSPLATPGQPAGAVPRIGYLDSRGPSDAGAMKMLEVFRQGLRELGYVEGKNIAIEYRFAEERLEWLPDLVAELVQLQVEIIVTWGPGIRAAMDATTLPIVMASTLDAVGSGFVASLARPGGNVTGLTLISTDLMGKRLELLKQTLPHLSRLALLTGPARLGGTLLARATEGAAQALGLRLQTLEVESPEDIENAFAAMARERAEALYVMEAPVLRAQQMRLAALATQHRLPTMFGVRGFVHAGGLMAYGPDPADLFRRAATYVHKILQGAKPADLPVEQPMKFELVLNLKTAQALGLTIPPLVRFRADEVIQ